MNGNLTVGIIIVVVLGLLATTIGVLVAPEAFGPLGDWFSDQTLLIIMICSLGLGLVTCLFKGLRRGNLNIRMGGDETNVSADGLIHMPEEK